VKRLLSRPAALAVPLLCLGLLTTSCGGSTDRDVADQEQTTTSEQSAVSVPTASTDGEDAFPTEKSMRSIDLRPVRQMAKMDDPTNTTPVQDVVYDGKGFVYLLGPSLASGYLVFTASANARDDGSFSVTVALSSAPEDIEAVTRATTTCIEKSEACPNGQLAFFSDGELVTIATVAQPPLDGVLQIDGFDTYDETQRIVNLLQP
jgi:hypothetical protein